MAPSLESVCLFPSCTGVTRASASCSAKCVLSLEPASVSAINADHLTPNQLAEPLLTGHLDPMEQPSQIGAAILRLVAARGADKSVCPSEVARALHPDWRPLMGPVRREAVRLAGAGRIDILRKGRPVAPETARGVIRLRIRPEPGE